MSGLTDDEAAARLATYGPNLIRQPRSRGFLAILRDTLREPMFMLLLGAAALYLVVGDLAEALFLSGGAIVALTLVIVQEERSEQALRALNALAEPRARVIRSGKARWIPARELVPGDLVLVTEGSRVPADGILVEGDALEVDESALTGESASVAKMPDESAAGARMSVPGEDRSASLFAATLVVRGQGSARVERTGMTTEVGRIGAALGGICDQPTLIQRDVRKLVGRLGILALAFCAIVAIAYGLARNDWLSGALSGLTLAMSLIPEEFPMVLTIFMGLGALRMARRNVLVRRSAVIETLGATDLLCVDKTGTITENRMSLRYVWADGQLHDLRHGIADTAKRVIDAAQRASTAHGHDPMDAAINSASRNELGMPLRTYPLSARLLAFTQVWRGPANHTLYCTKGAHDALLPLCSRSNATANAGKAAHELANAGARVLAVAEADFPNDPKTDPAAIRYRLVGLLGFEDPVRPEVRSAIVEAARAGVSVAMITGDYPATAKAIALSSGIDAAAGVLTGAELESLDVVPPQIRVFARVRPEQKLRLVQSFRQANHVVSMTGDGVNDAPALAAADVGIAMGLRGTDVAREASDLILLDDQFKSIIGGIALGRRIFANLRRAMTYITAVHIPVAGLALIPLLIGLPPMFYPMHVVLLELLFDPLCSIVFESEPSEKDAMERPPRRIGEPLFGVRQIALAAIQGSVLLAAVLVYYWLLNHAHLAEPVARTSAFIALVAGQLSLAGASRSPSGRLFSRGRRAFWIIVGAALVVMASSVTIPFFVRLLRFAVPTPSAILVSSAIGLASGGWTILLGRTPRLGNEFR